MRKYYDKDWLYEEYVVKNRTSKSICEECGGVAHQSLERFLRRYGIKKIKDPVYPTKDELFDLHLNQKLSVSRIVELFPGVGEKSIKRLMKEYDIPQIPGNELVKLWWSDQGNKERMSKVRKDLWQDPVYRAHGMARSDDKEKLRQRAIKHSAKYQGVSLEEWNGFLTPERTRIRGSSAYSAWRKKVFERDNYTCQCCGDRSCKGHPVTLHAHHIENFAHNEDLRFEVDNGITLCRSCHDIRVVGSFHNLYGVYDITREKLDEYLEMRKSVKSGSNVS